MAHLRAFVSVILAFAASVPAYADSDCKAYPGKDLVVLVTVSSQFEIMFKNWLFYASKFLNSSQQLVVWPEDAAIVDRLNLFADSSPTPFDIAKPEHFDVPSYSKNKSQRSFIRKETSDRNHAIDVDSHAWDFGTATYKSLVFSRPQTILHFLNQGCTLLYSDIDNVWLKSPFKQVAAAGNYDMYVTDDSNQGILDSGYVCTCFLYMRPAITVQVLMKRWADIISSASYRKNSWGNQRGFNTALRELSPIPRLATCLPKTQFPNGKTAKHLSKSELDDATVLHANYVSGFENKIDQLKKWGKWFK